MKIGILGGTFDPVHNGHLEIAGEVKRTLGLDRVLFIPARQSPFKADYNVTPAESRLEMLNAGSVEIERWLLINVVVQAP